MPKPNSGESILEYDDVESTGLTRRQYATIVSSLGVASLAGCAGENGNGDTDGNGGNGNGTGTDDDDGDAGEPQDGGTLEVALSTGLSNLDGHMQTAPADQIVTYANTDFLFRVDHDMEVVGGLVESVDVNDDGTQWEMNIHEGVTFHPPHERELTAEDIAWNFDHVTDPERFSPRNKPWAGIADWHAEDDHTFVIEFDEGQLEFDSYMAGWHGFPIYSPDAIEDGMDMQTEPVATGPFVFEDWVTGEQLTLTRFDDYWHDEYPYVDEVVFRPIPDGSGRMTEIMQGDVDIVVDVPFDLLSQLEDDDATVVDQTDSFAILDLLINPTEETEENRGEDYPTTHPEVRQAISEAIDRNAMVDIIYNGQATATQNYFPEGSPYHIDYNPHSMGADPDAARALLDEAGFDEPEVTLISTAERDDMRELGQITAENLEAAGFAPDLQEYEQTVWSDRMWAGEFDIAVEDLFGAPSLSALRGFWRYEEDDPPFFNYMYEEHETIYQMWDEEGLTEEDPEERLSIFAEVQRMMVDDPIRCVVCHPDQITAYNESVQGYSTHPWGSNLDIHGTWLDQ
ncbi:ABC transporter substrate-binding protein [Natrarchaeobius chitinivorans]|uniref:ABC transporter substrate-binding protein n=1 Tax=Natrarchaeobius chitinivorans TaxID=1679083 RepID=A0A3N6LW80_NATCH|nr:ABC transporter substrate-binding protein [Natrarchaeobius chitinivorans]RQG94843.1 ABC transporter substrate-binding protein [Natrarchaeobius chitinivorans]